MKKITITCLCLLLSLLSIGQNFDVPENIVLETEEDYFKYETKLVQAIEWLNNTPMVVEESKRKDVNLFVLQWITGSPTVTIEIQVEFSVYDNCAECLIIFMGGWIQKSIENEHEISLIQGNIAGIESAIDFYKKNKKTIGKDKKIEKLTKLKEKGKLEEYVKINLAN